MHPVKIHSLAGAFLIAVSGFLSGCQKELPTLPFETISTSLPGDVESLYRISADTIIACGGVPDDGWVIRSVNNGISWEVLSRGFHNSLNTVFFRDSQTGYCADSDVLIFKTTDGGVTWNQFYPNEWPLIVNRNLRDIQFVNDSLGFICGGKNFGNGLIYRTTDGGENWTYTEYTHELRSITFTGPLTGFAFGYGVILTTANGGQTWEPAGGSGRYFTASDQVTGNSFYRTTFDGEVGFSADGGNSWGSLRERSSAFGSSEKIFCIKSTAGGRVAISGHNGFLSFSSDGGRSWSDYRLFDGHTVNDLLLSEDGLVIAGGEDGTVFRIQMP